MGKAARKSGFLYTIHNSFEYFTMNNSKKNSPNFRIRFDKHHFQEFYFLPSKKEYAVIPTKEGKLTKSIGPAIIQVDQRGILRRISKHPINGPQVWSILLGYMEAGVWALSDRHVAPLLPAHLLKKSKRFFDIDTKRKSRMMKRTRDELKARKVFGTRSAKSR